MMMIAVLITLVAGQMDHAWDSDRSEPEPDAVETEIYRDPEPMSILYLDATNDDVMAYAASLGHVPAAEPVSDDPTLRAARRRFKAATEAQQPVTVAEFIPMLGAMQSSSEDDLAVPAGVNERVAEETAILMSALTECNLNGGSANEAMFQIHGYVCSGMVSAAWLSISRMLITLAQHPERAADLSVMVDDREARHFGAHGAVRPRTDGPRVPRFLY